MKKTTIAAAAIAFVVGIACSASILRMLGARITWYAPWLRPEGYTAEKAEYMRLMDYADELSEIMDSNISNAYEDGYDQGCMDMLDDDLGTNYQ